MMLQLHEAATRPRRRRAKLTADEILAAIRRWDELHGEPPSMADWDPYRARKIGQAWRIARYDDGSWPSIKSVRNHFGKLSAAVAAAGLVPRHQGEQRPRVELELDENTKLHLAHVDAMRSHQDPPDMVASALRNLANARQSSESEDLQVALIELAAAALAWARRVAPTSGAKTAPPRVVDRSAVSGGR
jgi:hypothetical protein